MERTRHFTAGLAGSLLAFFLLPVLLVAAELPMETATCDLSFRPGGWRPADWLLVKSPRWSHVGEWRQEADHLANAVPADATDEAMLGPRAPETYSSMLWRTRLAGNFTVASTMSFDYRMAPLIVLTSAPGATADGQAEYREHWEVVLYDEGINVWHHEYKAGKPVWHLAAMTRHAFKPGVKYDLKVTLTRQAQGTMIDIACGDARLAYMEHDLPRTLLVGLTGCEGVNRFYDFRVTRP